MPELPEVEVVRSELNPKIIHQKIKEIKNYWHKTFVNHCDELPLNKKIIKTHDITILKDESKKR